MSSTARWLAAVGAVALTLLGAPPALADDPPVAPTQSTQCVQAGRGEQITQPSNAQRRLDLDAVHAVSSGAGVTVAVIDTGVTPHPALADRLLPGPDLVVPEEQSLHDCDGHGTLVAGIIAAGPIGAADAAGSDPVFVGVAPHARILSIRQASGRYAYPGQGASEPVGDVSTLAAAINAAVAAGVQVINISQTGCVAVGTVNAGDDQLAAAVAAAEAADVVVVAAAGNTGNSCKTNNVQGQPPVTIPLPAKFDTVLSVAAVGDDDSVADFSLVGPWVDIAAPGTDIVSLDPGPGGTGLVNKTSNGDTLNPLNGTSFAAPYVSGVAALVRSAHPELTAAQVRDRITATAQHPPSNTDRNDAVGYGLIDPAAAVSGLAAVPTVSAQSLLPAAPPPVVPDTEPRNTALLVSGVTIAAAVLLAALLVASRRAMRLRRPPLPRAELVPDRRVGAGRQH